MFCLFVSFVLFLSQCAIACYCSCVEAVCFFVFLFSIKSKMQNKQQIDVHCFHSELWTFFLLFLFKFFHCCFCSDFWLLSGCCMLIQRWWRMHNSFESPLDVSITRSLTNYNYRQEESEQQATKPNATFLNINPIFRLRDFLCCSFTRSYDWLPDSSFVSLSHRLIDLLRRWSCYHFWKT